jgi:hypothetical protein
VYRGVDRRAPAVEKPVFRAITQSVSEWSTRRSLLKAAGVSTLAAILGAALDPTGTAAKRRRVHGEHNIRGNKAIMCIDGKTVRVAKKKRKKHLKRGATRGKCNSCTPVCTPGICGDDGCGGTCGCVDGTLCVSGTCEACDVACASGDSAACGETLNKAIAQGGTVHVCPGRYSGPFPLTTSVEIIGAGSGDDPATGTILLGAAGQGSVVPVTTASVTARLASLRVTGGNGTSNNSGGVYISHMTANVTIEDCALVENTGSYGGGVSVYYGTLTVRGSDISYNTATHGGGVATATLSTFESTTITYNTASSEGGGIFVNSGTINLDSSVTVTNNTSNGRAGTGGGIYKYSSPAVINGAAVVTNNTPDNCAGNGYTC